MRRIKLTVEKKYHRYHNGTGFATKQLAMDWAACERAVMRNGGPMEDIMIVHKYFRATLNSLSIVEKLNP